MTSRATPEIRIVPDAEELAHAAATEFVRLTKEAVRAKGSFTVALAGGSTPKRLYTLLGDKTDSFRSQIAWDRIQFFWGDERHVPPDHPESNYRMVHETLLSKAPVPPGNIHRMAAENPDAQQIARAYEQVIQEIFRLQPGEWPRFDLMFLGMGADGHTASIFPGTTVIHEQKCLVAACWVEKLNAYRLTLTPPVLNHAASLIFLVSGQDKAETLRKILHGAYQPECFPTQIIRPYRGQLLWLVDREAARFLEDESGGPTAQG